MTINLEDEPPEKTTYKTFIHDHKLAMDPCLHVRHFWHHGQFLGRGNGPAPQPEMAPQFSYTSSSLHHDIHMPFTYLWVEDILPRSSDPEWDEKIDARLMWRGSSTGLCPEGQSANIGLRLQSAHRLGLVQLANDLRGTVSILPPVASETELVGEPVEVHKSRLNPGIMDIALSGNPMMCSVKFCQYLQEILPWRRRQTIQEAGNYKYVFDVRPRRFYPGIRGF
jgi:hypothetical protein